MRTNKPTMLLTDDDEELSALLLNLARDVRKAVHERPAAPDETTALNGRLSQLRSRFHGGNETSLNRWLEKLQNQLDESCASTAL